jgi:predicted nucleic acid-binding protein
MPLLISDANIIIDLSDGGILPLMFQLDHEFVTSDILFQEELEGFEHDLLALGLRLVEVNSVYMSKAFELKERYSGPSRNDCMLLSLAMQENCPLLTGDHALRKAAQAEDVDVMGTIWLVQQMILHGIISKADAQIAFERMRELGSRLPWARVEEMLQALP